MPTRNINLTDYYDQFVEELVTSGRFSNASEVMRAGLRLLEQQAQEEKEKLTAIRSLAAEGFGEIDQGLGSTIENEEQLANLIDRLGRKAGKKI